MGGGNDNIFIAEVVDGSNVVFDANYIHGSLDNDATNDMSGLKVSGTRGAKVINNEFEQVGRGVVFGSVRDVIVANNMVHRIRSDGFNFAQSKRLLIEGNYFTASQRARWDHPDAIQFWTARTKSPSTDIMIRNNEIIQGKGSGTQGIFMKDETDQLPYERVTIENNLMIGSVLLNGIYVQNARNLRIVNNTVISPTDLKDSVWIRLLKVKDVEFEGNIAERGGNKTPREAKVNMKMMKNDTFRDVKPEDVIVPGFGYQKPQ